MLNINIANFRGIKDARITCSRIALLCGQNEQGKSSAIDAIRSVLDGTAQPYGLKKDDIVELLYNGADQAHATLVESNDGHDDRTMQMRWPAGDIATMGAPFRSTAFASGSKRFTGLPDRDRAQELAKYLRTEPDRDEFVAAMKDSGMTIQAVQEAWKDTVSLGWDGAWQKHKTEGTKLKGGWEAITGGSYGIKVGGNWRPKGWGPDHEAMTDDDIELWKLEAQTALDAAIGTVAINDDEKKRLEATVKNIPKLQELVDTRNADGQRSKAILTKAEEALRKIPVLPPDNWPNCPHCKKAVQVQAGKNGASILTVPPKALDPAEREKIIEQSEAAERILKGAQDVHAATQTAWLTANGDLTKAKDAKAQLEQEGPKGPAVNLDALRADLNNAKSVESGRAKVRAAVAKHAEVIAKLNLVNALAPDGLRKAKLTSKLDGFNTKLAGLCEVAGWGPVVVDENGEVSLADIMYELCARSGRMRIDVTLQVAFGLIDGSEIFLVDDADMLDGRGRNGLFALLAHTERYCVIGMMLTKSAQTPDLDAVDLGNSYWVNGAVAMPLEDIKTATKAA